MPARINRLTDERSLSLRWGYTNTRWGMALAAVAEGQLCWLDLRPGHTAEQQLFAAWQGAEWRQEDAYVNQIVSAALDASAKPAPTRPALLVRASDFQLQVWRALTQIPPGETRTYGELAAAMGRPGAARAVGSAAAANVIALLIPCHRLVPASGGYGAFRWGAELKAALLAAEAESCLPAGCASAPKAA